MTFSCIAFLLLLHSPWLLFLRVAIYRDTRVKWFFIKAPWDLHQQTRFPLSARCVWREAWCRTVIAVLAGLMTLGELWKNDVKGVVWKVWPHLLPSAIIPDLLSSTAAHAVLCTENSGVKELRVTENIWLHYTATNAWTVRLFLSVEFLCRGISWVSLPLLHWSTTQAAQEPAYLQCSCSQIQYTIYWVTLLGDFTNNHIGSFKFMFFFLLLQTWVISVHKSAFCVFCLWDVFS